MLESPGEKQTDGDQDKSEKDENGDEGLKMRSATFTTGAHLEYAVRFAPKFVLP